MLNCDHCRKHLLESMIHAPTPDKLVEVCKDLHTKGAKGCLISGGADERGRVPLGEYIEAIKTVKKQTNLKLVVHTGLIDSSTSKKLADARIDAASIDVIGDKDTVRRVYHMDATPEDYLKSMRNLKKAGIKIAPHIVVGLDNGKINGEFTALEMIKKINPNALVLVSLMPLKNTPMQYTIPPKTEDVCKMIAISRIMLPNTPVILGCARDRRSKSILDRLAVKAGVNAIAHPSMSAVEDAKKEGLDVSFDMSCCAYLALG